MLVLVDDIKLRSERDFISYISKEFNDAYIDGLAGLEEYLNGTSKEIEFILSDFDDVEDDGFAAKVLSLLEKVSKSNKNITITMM